MTTINTLHTLQNINKETINHYLTEKGKQKKTLSDEEFQKLFGEKGKYNKAEINQ